MMSMHVTRSHGFEGRCAHELGASEVGLALELQARLGDVDREGRTLRARAACMVSTASQASPVLCGGIQPAAGSLCGSSIAHLSKHGGGAGEAELLGKARKAGARVGTAAHRRSRWRHWMLLIRNSRAPELR